MMWKNSPRAAFAALALALTVAACNDEPNSRDALGPNTIEEDGGANDASMVYEQREFLGNPLISEVTILKANHDGYNQTQPYNTATYAPETKAFITSFGRPQALADLLGSILYPDILIVDPSKDPNTAGWLSWALADGWGGRKLADDVTDVGLSAIFSSLLDPNGALCAPFELPLCTDNVPANDKTFLTHFPYLAMRH
ncbi:MAG: DUF4331 family protein [Gemmatimonadaceae bacterium]